MPAPRQREIVARRDRQPVGPMRQVEPGMVEIRAEPSPIEMRVRVEDRQPAADHHEDRDRIDPMPDPRRETVAVDARKLTKWRGCLRCLIGRASNGKGGEGWTTKPLPPLSRPRTADSAIG